MLYVRAFGGPNQSYRPMTDCPDLWRELADKCDSHDGILKFVSKYGLLDPKSSPEPGRPNEPVGWIWGTALTLRNMCTAIDEGRVERAAEIFTTKFELRLRVHIRKNLKTGKFEYTYAPETLRGAILLQTVGAITENLKFSRFGHVNAQ